MYVIDLGDFNVFEYPDFARSEENDLRMAAVHDTLVEVILAQRPDFFDNYQTSASWREVSTTNSVFAHHDYTE